MKWISSTRYEDFISLNWSSTDPKKNKKMPERQTNIQTNKKNKQQKSSTNWQQRKLKSLKRFKCSNPMSVCMYVWSVHSKELLYFVSEFSWCFHWFSFFKSGVSQSVSQSPYLSIKNFLQICYCRPCFSCCGSTFISNWNSFRTWNHDLLLCVFFFGEGDLSIWRLRRWHRQSPEYIPRSSIADTTRIPSAKMHQNKHSAALWENLYANPQLEFKPWSTKEIT